MILRRKTLIKSLRTLVNLKIYLLVGAALVGLPGVAELLTVAASALVQGTYQKQALVLIGARPVKKLQMIT